MLQWMHFIFKCQSNSNVKKIINWTLTALPKYNFTMHIRLLCQVDTGWISICCTKPRHGRLSCETFTWHPLCSVIIHPGVKLLLKYYPNKSLYPKPTVWEQARGDEWTSSPCRVPCLQDRACCVSYLLLKNSFCICFYNQYWVFCPKVMNFPIGT